VGTVAAGVVAWAWVGPGEVRPLSWWRPVGARVLVLWLWWVVGMLVWQLLVLGWWVGRAVGGW
jgi:hypothetical protein